ncbi:hypothetical protein ACP70R_046102 [Stipagrostis hirtigluma subsp. patula]
MDPSEGKGTPPPNTYTVTAAKNSSAKGKEISSGAHEEHVNNVLGKRPRSARKELFSSKKEKASDE